MEYVEKIEAKYVGLTAKIISDCDPQDPREDDNFGTMVCFHKRYRLMNEAKLCLNDFEGWDAMEKHIREELRAVIVLPVYMYDHSGLTISTTSFNDRWDSGQIGFIYVTREQILANFMVKKLSKKTMEHARKLIIGEVAEYDQFLRGDVYGYDIQNEDGTSLDSCWGFFGIEYARQSAKAALDGCAVNVTRKLDQENNHGNGI